MGVVRTTLLVDPKGVVREFWEKVKVAGHAAAVLEKSLEVSKRSLEALKRSGVKILGYNARTI
jgi:hypothetical protein